MIILFYQECAVTAEDGCWHGYQSPLVYHMAVDPYIYLI